MDTRSDILATAEALLQERGYNGFSYRDIADRLGVKNAAIHYHFPNKSDLGVALVERYAQRFRDLTDHLESQSASWRDKVRAYLGIAVHFVRSNQRLCPLSVLETEFFTLPESVQKAAQGLDQTMRTWLSHVLEQGRLVGEIQFNGKAEDKALLIMAAGQGSMQIARVAGNKRFFSALHQIESDLGLKP